MYDHIAVIAQSIINPHNIGYKLVKFVHPKLEYNHYYVTKSPHAV